MKKDIKKKLTIGDLLPYFKWPIGLIIVISIILCIYERHLDTGFHNPDVPIVVYILLWSYVIMQMIAVSILEFKANIAWVILNISSLGIILLLITILFGSQFYLSYFYIHFHFPVFGMGSIILMALNNNKRNRRKWHIVTSKSGYLQGFLIPILITAIFYIIFL